MSRKKKFIFGAFALNFKSLIVGILSIVITPILLKKIDANGYGIWVLIGNIVGYINLFDFGITGSSNTLIARTKNNISSLNKLISNVLFLQTLIGFVILLVGFVFSFFIESFFNINSKDAPSVELVFLLSVFSLALSFPIRTYVSVLVGNQLIHNNAFIELFVHIITIFIQLVLLEFNFGLFSLPLGLISTRLLLFYIYYRYVKIKLPELSVTYKHISFKEMKSILNVSTMWFLGSLAAMIIYSSDNILIGKYISTEAVAKYTLTFLLVEFLRQRLYSFNSAAMPGIAELFGNNEIHKIRSVYLKTQRLVWTIALLAFQIIFLFNESFVSLWVGKQYFIGSTANVLFATYLFLTIIFHSSSIIISSSLNIKGISLFRLLEATINISLSIFLIKKYGYVGLIGSTIFALLITNFWYAPIKTLAILKITKIEYFKTIIIKVLPVFLIFIVFNVLVFIVFKTFFNLLFIRLLFFVFLSLCALYLIEKKIILDIFNKIKTLKK